MTQKKHNSEVQTSHKIKQDLKSLPEKPGIYKMLSSSGGILYIGKAKNIKKRVKSYFLNSKNHDIKTRSLVSKIQGIEYIATQTETEALILENQLIKKETPKYNILLRDDKTYPYIKISRAEPFPRVLVVRERKNDNAYYFGPYPSIGSTKYLIKLLCDLFPIRDCKQKIDLQNRQPKCIKLDLGKCIGPCIYKQVKSDYDELINKLIWMLKGKNQSVVTYIKSKMKEAAVKKKYELAATYRDQIIKINKMTEKQRVSFDKKVNALVCVLEEGDQYRYLLCRTILEGQLLYQNGFYIEKSEDCYQWATEAIKTIEFELGLKSIEIICDHDIIKSLKDHEFESKVKIVEPQKGEKLALLKSAQSNARLALKKIELDKSRDIIDQKNNLISAHEMKQTCKLNNMPNTIIGVDISHLQGTNIIGSSVCFNPISPLKKEYRQYNLNIKFNKSNDPLCIYEVVKRRAESYFKAHNSFPDLFLIDGGVGQLNFAIKALDEVSATSDCVAIAKKEEILYSRNNPPLQLNKYNRVRLHFQKIRDEAHRFGVAAQRKKRTRESLEIRLAAIKGIGKKRIELLYKKYLTIEEIKRQPLGELKKIGKIGDKLARKIIAVLDSK